MGARPLLSAAIIVKNEADFLRKCLGSIRDVCDEIVVIDTGSTDDSVQVAREYGAISGYREWDEDFAAARNYALDTATGEWILYIDADEVLEDMDVAAAREELRRATDAVSLLLKFRMRPSFSPYQEFRMWRHRPDIRFEGRIHETMVPFIKRISEDEGLAIRPSEHFSICHYGYEGDQTRKNLRNLPLLERRVIEYPNRCYLWNHLATIRRDLGDDAGALDAWETGLDLIRARGMLDTTDVLIFSGLGYFLLRRGEDISGLLEEAFAIAPWFHALHDMAARNHQNAGRWTEAIPHLEALIDVGHDPVSPTVAYDNRIFTVVPHLLLADSKYALGDLRGALEAYEICLRYEPDAHNVKTRIIALKTMIARSGAGRPD